MNNLDTDRIVDEIKHETFDLDNADGNCGLLDVSKEDLNLILNHADVLQGPHNQDVLSQLQDKCKSIDFIKFENEDLSNVINYDNQDSVTECKADGCGVDEERHNSANCVCGYNFVKKPHCEGDVVVIPIKCETIKQWIGKEFKLQNKKSRNKKHLKLNKRQSHKKKKVKNKHKKKIKRIKLNVCKEKVCPICGEKMKAFGLVDKHLTEVHPGQKPYICDLCEMSFSFKRNIYQHIVRVHLSSITVRPYSCSFCQKSFIVKNLRDSHVKRHNGGKMYMCEICKYQSNSASSYRDHVRLHTGEKPFKCDFCEKSFRIRKSYRHHVRMHTGEKPYKCEHCDKTFRLAKSLKIHTFIHTGDRPFLCNICGHRFSVLPEMNRHIITHVSTNEEVFLVKKHSVFGQLKASVDIVREHEDIDSNTTTWTGDTKDADGTTVVTGDTKDADGTTVVTNEQFLRCNICNKLFFYKGDLNFHMKKHEKPYSCLYCGKAYGMNSDLKQHLNFHRICKYCQVTFPSPSLALSHQDSCSGKVKYPTYKINAVDIESNKIVVKRQQNGDKFQPQEHCKPKALPKCFCCKLEFTSYAELRDHLHVHVKCGRCNRLIKNNEEKVKHEATCSEVGPDKTKGATLNSGSPNKILTSSLNTASPIKIGIKKLNMNIQNHSKVSSNIKTKDVRNPPLILRTNMTNKQTPDGTTNSDLLNTKIVKPTNSNITTTPQIRIRSDLEINSNVYDVRNTNDLLPRHIGLGRKASSANANMPTIQPPLWNNYVVNSNSTNTQPYFESRRDVFESGMNPNSNIVNTLVYRRHNVAATSETQHALTNNNVMNITSPSKPQFRRNHYYRIEQTNIPKCNIFRENYGKTQPTLTSGNVKNIAIQSHPDSRNKNSLLTRVNPQLVIRNNEINLGMQYHQDSRNSIQPQIGTSKATVTGGPPQPGNAIAMNMLSQTQLNTVNNNIKNALTSPPLEFRHHTNSNSPFNRMPQHCTTMPQYSSQGVNIRSIPPQYSSQGVDISAQPPQYSSQGVNIRSQPPQYSSQGVDISTQPPQYSSQGVDISAQPPQYSSQGVDISAQPPQYSSQGVDIRAQPSQYSSQGVDIRAQSRSAPYLRVNNVETEQQIMVNSSEMTHMQPNSNHSTDTGNESKFQMSNNFLNRIYSYNSSYGSVTDPKVTSYLGQSQIQYKQNILPNINTMTGCLEGLNNNIQYSESDESFKNENEFIDISELKINHLS